MAWDFLGVFCAALSLEISMQFELANANPWALKYPWLVQLWWIVAAASLLLALLSSKWVRGIFQQPSASKESAMHDRINQDARGTSGTNVVATHGSTVNVNVLRSNAQPVDGRDAVRFKRKDRMNRGTAKGPSGADNKPRGPMIVSCGSSYVNNGGAGISTNNPNATISSTGDFFKGNKKGGIVDESK